MNVYEIIKIAQKSLMEMEKQFPYLSPNIVRNDTEFREIYNRHYKDEIICGAESFPIMSDKILRIKKNECTGSAQAFNLYKKMFEPSVTQFAKSVLYNSFPGDYKNDYNKLGQGTILDAILDNTICIYPNLLQPRLGACCLTGF